MESIELLGILACGEDSSHQFKKNINNTDSMAHEMIAFSNGSGGRVFIGVNDDGSIAGLSAQDIQRLNQLISNAASQHVIPAINPITENVQTENGIVLVLTIQPGISKPYQDKDGAFWVKSGSDKRKATSREEIQRMFQSANLLHADELPVPGLTAADLDLDYFSSFFQKRYNENLDTQALSLPRLLKNMNLYNDDSLNVACSLLFAKSPQYQLPAFIVKAGAFDSNEASTSNYSDSRNIEGKLANVFRETVGFILSNLRHVQGEQDVNSIGIPEIPVESIEELVANALIHRNYFISAPIRVFVFRNRIEIISPGHLPNQLTIENIKAGNSNFRNPILASYANNLLPYRGFGQGIIRALEKYPNIEFIDDRDGNQFKVILWRKEET